MRRMRKYFAITILILVAGLGTPAAYAGNAESPGQRTEESSLGPTVTTEETAESTGYFGVAESPGVMATFMIYLDVII